MVKKKQATSSKVSWVSREVETIRCRACEWLKPAAASIAHSTVRATRKPEAGLVPKTETTSQDSFCREWRE